MRKITAICLALAMGMSLAGCNGAKKQEEQTQPGESVVQQEPETLDILEPYFMSPPTVTNLNLHYRYVEFGTYPQTKLKPEEITAEIEQGTYDENRNMAIDGRVIHREEIEGEYHYYYVEPIRWKIIKETEDRVELWSDNILECMEYGSPDCQEWKDSKIRAFLNDEFIRRAFTPEEQKDLIPVQNKNYKSTFFYPMSLKEGETMQYDETDDLLFLGSYYEMTEISFNCRYKNWEGVFDPGVYVQCSEEFYRCLASDYAEEQYYEQSRLRGFQFHRIGKFDHNMYIPYHYRTTIEGTEYVVSNSIFGYLWVEEEDTGLKNRPSGVRPLFWMNKERAKAYLVNQSGKE